MAFSELQGIEKKLYLETKIKELDRLYGQTQKKLLAQLAQVDITEFQRYRTEAILKQVNLTVKVLDGGARKWAVKTIPYAYKRGVDIAGQRLKALKVTDKIAFDAQIHTSGINILADQVTMDLLEANGSIRKNFSRFIRATQQRIIEDKMITRQIAEGLIRGEARRAVSDRMLNEFRKRLGEEKFITINGRNYRPDKYAKLVARTRTREATGQGTINSCLQYGMDLVQVDVHADACEYCQQFMGRVYSISGNHPEFPMLSEEPPFHPQCECNLLPITEESLRSRGYYQQEVKLSNSPTIKIPSFSRFEELIGEM